MQTRLDTHLGTAYYFQHGCLGERHHEAVYLIPKRYQRWAAVNDSDTPLHIIPVEGGGYTVADRYYVFGFANTLQDVYGIIPKHWHDEFTTLMLVFPELIGRWEKEVGTWSQVMQDRWEELLRISLKGIGEL